MNRLTPQTERTTLRLHHSSMQSVRPRSHSKNISTPALPGVKSHRPISTKLFPHNPESKRASLCLATGGSSGSGSSSSSRIDRGDPSIDVASLEDGASSSEGDDEDNVSSDDGDKDAKGKGGTRVADKLDNSKCGSWLIFRCNVTCGLVLLGDLLQEILKEVKANSDLKAKVANLESVVLELQEGSSGKRKGKVLPSRRVKVNGAAHYTGS